MTRRIIQESRGRVDRGGIFLCDPTSLEGSRYSYKIVRVSEATKETPLTLAYATAAGRLEAPIRNSSTPRAALRPSAIAHTIND